MIRISEYLKKVIYKYAKEKTTIIEERTHTWSHNSGIHFYGSYQQSLIWHTVYGLAPMQGLPDTHGYSMLPNIRCFFLAGKCLESIGWIEDISMHSGGVVRIKHFALAVKFTRSGIGVIFFNAMITFFREINAVSIEFHESHTSKKDHYRRFFEKNEIKEVSDGVWKIELYKNNDIPSHVIDFQSALKM